MNLWQHCENLFNKKNHETDLYPSEMFCETEILKCFNQSANIFCHSGSKFPTTCQAFSVLSLVSVVFQQKGKKPLLFQSQSAGTKQVENFYH